MVRPGEFASEVTEDVAAGKDETQQASTNTLSQYQAKCTKWFQEEDIGEPGEVCFGM